MSARCGAYRRRNSRRQSSHSCAICFAPLWDELFPAEQARIVRLLVERIDLAPDGMQVRLRAEGLHTLVEELRHGRSGRMRTKRKIAGANWEFDGTTITVHIPMTWKRHGGRKVIIAPDGGDAWAPAKPRPDETLIRALARAHRWKRMLEDGKYRSAAEIAEAEGVTRSFVNRLLRLTLLAPDIQEAILDGRQPKAHAAGRADAGDANHVGRAKTTRP